MRRVVPSRSTHTSPPGLTRTSSTSSSWSRASSAPRPSRRATAARTSRSRSSPATSGARRTACRRTTVSVSPCSACAARQISVTSRSLIAAPPAGPTAAGCGRRPRDAGQEQAGVDGSGDGGVEGERRQHGGPDRVLDVARSQGPARLVHQHDAVGSRTGSRRPPEAEVARPGDEDERGTGASGRQGRVQVTGAGVDDDVEGRGREPLGEVGPAGRVRRDRRWAAGDEPGGGVELDAQVFDGPAGQVGGEPVPRPWPAGSGRPRTEGWSPSRSTRSRTTGLVRAEQAATTVVPLPPFTAQQTVADMFVLRGRAPGWAPGRPGGCRCCERSDGV